jgi:7-carboxy-7-deazaguanine synthase
MKINEIFKTIQGEATFTGTPSLFIRTQGCPVWCNWCDTKFTWHLGKKSKLIDQKEIIGKVEQDERFADFTEEDLLNVAKQYNIKHIVITGGEPCINDLTKLTDLFINNNFSVQIETSCTQQIKCNKEVWVTGSPKIDMSGKQEVVPNALQRANEIKFPILNNDDLNNLISLVKNNNLQDKLIWLQPIDIDGDRINTTDLCVDACYKYNINLSVQTHKYINLK